MDFLSALSSFSRPSLGISTPSVSLPKVPKLFSQDCDVEIKTPSITSTNREVFPTEKTGCFDHGFGQPSGKKFSTDSLQAPFSTEAHEYQESIPKTLPKVPKKSISNVKELAKTNWDPFEDSTPQLTQVLHAEQLCHS